MIRIITLGSLLSLLILVLYLPSAYPPEHFMSRLRAEHELASDFWGREAGARVLARMLDLQASAKEAGPVASLSSAPAPGGVGSAVARQMSEVNSRLFRNEYFKSIDSLFALATYRFCVFAEGLPFLLVFLAAALFDGFVTRIIRSKEFLQHDPEMFALHACAAFVTACATVVAFVLPVTVSPPALCIVPIAVSVFASRALANFHRRA